MRSNLRPYLRPKLDVLFVGLNPPQESDANGHYFSGQRSRFFQLLYESGLIVKSIPRAAADEVVFASTVSNYRNLEFGVVDLIEDLVQTNSGTVRTTRENVRILVGRIREFSPRFVCIIHSKVRDALNDHAGLAQPLTYGLCGALLPDCESHFVLNYFPNGNRVPDEPKLRIFCDLRDAL